jgi:sulfur-oxidizing protein SoxY
MLERAANMHQQERKQDPSAVEVQRLDPLVQGMLPRRAVCGSPHLKGDWAQHLSEVRGRASIDTSGGARVRLAFRHPMDTGFVAGIPTYNLETVRLTGPGGADYGTVGLEASVGEDPALTLITPAKPGEILTVAGRDTNGIEYSAKLSVSATPA